MDALALKAILGKSEAQLALLQSMPTGSQMTWGEFPQSTAYDCNLTL